MVLIDMLWDDVFAGPQPNRGLGKLRKTSNLTVKTNGEGSSKIQRSLTMPASPVGPLTPTTPSPTGRKDGNVWRSVFHPGSNIATKNIGNEVFDKPKDANSPTVYDWLYSGDTRSKHR